MRHCTVAVIGALVLLAGCRRSRTMTGDGPSASAAVVASATSSASTPARPGLTEASVRELVTKWAAAQSTDDFAGYDTLYAERFTGVKRAGSYTARLARKEWMKDRKTMIGPGLVVEATDVTVAVTPEAATAHFVQHYKSPKFEDTGPKLLVVVATSAGPRIAREEMLSSAIQMQGLGRRLANRLHAAESGGVFLGAGLPANASKGALANVKPETVPVHSVASAVDASMLTDDQRSFVGRSVTAYDAAGKPCSAVLRSLSVRAMVTPHFGAVQQFADGSVYPDRAVAAREMAKMFYELAGDEGRYLFGEFEKPCPGARWAIDGTAIPVVVRTPSTDEGAAIAAFRALPKYHELESAFESEQPENKGKPWETYDGQIVFDVFQPAKGAPLLAVGARGGSGCGEFWGSMTAIFDAHDASHPVARGVLSEPPSVPHFLAGVDLDADGELELISGPDGEQEEFALIVPDRKGVYLREVFFSAPFLDCPC